MLVYRDGAGSSYVECVDYLQCHFQASASLTFKLVIGPAWRHTCVKDVSGFAACLHWRQEGAKSAYLTIMQEESVEDLVIARVPALYPTVFFIEVSL